MTEPEYFILKKIYSNSTVESKIHQALNKISTSFFRWSRYNRSIFLKAIQFSNELMALNSVKDNASDTSLFINYNRKLNSQLTNCVKKISLNLDRMNFNSSKKHKYLIKIKNKLKDIEDLIFTCIIHGSFSDNTEQTDFSDLDVFIVIDDIALTSPMLMDRVLVTLQSTFSLFYKIDPLAHHEYARVFFKSELECYPQYQLPIDVISVGKVLLGSSKVDFSPWRCHWSESRMFFQRLTTFRKLNVLHEFTAFEYKCLISELCLIPSLFYQSTNRRFLYKKNAIYQFNIEFNDPYFLNFASYSREEWKVRRFNKLNINMDNHKLFRVTNKLSIYLENFFCNKVNKLNFSLAIQSFNDIFDNVAAYYE